MWIIVMFDLPTDTKHARKAYHEFREELLNDGFTMLQFSVYARHTPSEENAVVHENRVKNVSTGRRRSEAVKNHRQTI